MRPRVRSKTPRTKNGYQGKKNKNSLHAKLNFLKLCPQLPSVSSALCDQWFEWDVLLFFFLSGSMQVHLNQNIFFFFFFTHCWSRAQPRSTGLSKTHLLCQSENTTAATAHVVRLSGDVKANALSCKLIKAWSPPLLIQRKVSRFSKAAM